MDYLQDLRRSGTLPYPNLIQGFETANQQRFFLEPKNPSKAGGAGRHFQSARERVLEKSIQLRFEKFGSISHIYRQDRLGKGSHFFMFYRRDRGCIDHGLARNNEDVYECAKMNVLWHPLRYDYNNPDYASEPRLSEIPAVKSLISLYNYPAIPNAVMSAPLLPRCGPISENAEDGPMPGQFARPKHVQPMALTSVFEIPELCIAVMREVGHRWGDLSNLSRTCQMIMFAINAVSTHVDVLNGNFVNLDLSDAEIEAANAISTPEEAQLGKIMQPTSPQFLIVSNVRAPYQTPEGGEDEPDEFGFPARPKGQRFKPTAERRIIDTYRFLRMIDVRGHHIKILHLHSVPNFDIHLLKMCLERLPDLEVLGVYNCELLHFGKTLPFLEAIIERNEKPGRKFLRSDFSPMYYPGLRVGSKGRTGEYGVIPSDHGLIDTRRAITAVLRKVVPLALKNDIDWFTPGAGMRQYLERIPFALGTLRYILEACYNLYYQENGFYYPCIVEMLRRNLPAEGNAARHEQMYRSLYNDLILAVEGTSMEQEKLTNLTLVGNSLILMQCAFCKANLPAYFYTQESADRQADQVQCCGCQLVMQLDHQIENFFQEKEQVMRMLFDDEQITDVSSFLNAKRTPTEEELGNPRWDFWLVSVKSQAEVVEARPESLILDGRPGPEHDEEAKQVWVWKERVAKAMKYARLYIDNGDKSVQRKIEACKRDVQVLNDLYFESKLANAGEIRKNRDMVNDIERFIIQERARCGLAQMVGRYGASLAANWDDEIKKYREIVQLEAGVLSNGGPRDIWETSRGFF
ncbi:hypothetical protein F5Y11DRAFT_344623 [Daldinia sp. FL1419]|nr:hypothetical protein F5Y11DRAFT_344623 [Daldinia sp. FL1419]